MRKILILFGVLLALMLFYSCASAPEPAPEPEPVKPAPTVQPAAPTVPLPEAEYVRAKELREHIGTYGLAKYGSEDFKRGEDAFVLGESRYGKENAEAKQAFVTAAAAYQKVIESGAAAIMKEKEDAVLASRRAADEVSAARYASDPYRQADAAAAKAMAAYQAASGSGEYGKFVEAAALADDAVYLYDIARQEVLVQQRQAVIEQYGLREYLPRNQYEGANAQYAKGRSLVGKNNEGAAQAYRAAVLGYEDSIESAARTVTANRRKDAEGQKSSADSLKAAVAVKQPYQDAAAVYGQAVSKQREAERTPDKEKKAMLYYETVALYEDARSRFAQVTEVAREKRERALEAMQRARQDVETAQENASEAEKIIQQGTL